MNAKLTYWDKENDFGILKIDNKNYVIDSSELKRLKIDLNSLSVLPDLLIKVKIKGNMK